MPFVSFSFCYSLLAQQWKKGSNLMLMNQVQIRILSRSQAYEKVVFSASHSMLVVELHGQVLQLK